MEDLRHWTAGKCLERLRDAIEPSELGFRIQGLAAHVLLRLGLRVVEVNSIGHPDIVAEAERGFVRVEVEADLHGWRARALTKEDLDAIAPRGSLDRGYFAVAICGPYPRWIVVDSVLLQRRRGTPASPAIFQALCDSEASALWTAEFISLLLSHCEHLVSFSFDFLVRRALEGRPL